MNKRFNGVAAVVAGALLTGLAGCAGLGIQADDGGRFEMSSSDPKGVVKYLETTEGAHVVVATNTGQAIILISGSKMYVEASKDKDEAGNSVPVQVRKKLVFASDPVDLGMLNPLLTAKVKQEMADSILAKSIVFKADITGNAAIAGSSGKILTFHDNLSGMNCRVDTGAASKNDSLVFKDFTILQGACSPS